MNIEKLAKRLKEFTLDDIELIAECDCKTPWWYWIDSRMRLQNKTWTAFEQQ